MQKNKHKKIVKRKIDIYEKPTLIKHKKIDMAICLTTTGVGFTTTTTTQI